MKLIDGQRTKVLKIWIKDILIAVVIVALITTFLLQNFKVVGGSMLPTLHHGEIVVVNKLIYRIKQPMVGDIIGFTKDDKQMVKRIIGLPGDVIDYIDGVIYVNEVPINNSDDSFVKIKGDIDYPYTVKENTYFVIGDNYNNSIDSRYKAVDAIHEDEIMGKVQFRLWPFWKKPFIK